MPKFRIVLEIEERDEAIALSLVEHAIENSGCPDRFKILSIKEIDMSRMPYRVCR